MTDAKYDPFMTLILKTLFAAMYVSIGTLHGNHADQDYFHQKIDGVTAYYQYYIPRWHHSAKANDKRLQATLYSAINGSLGDLSPLKHLWGKEPASHWYNQALKQYQDEIVYLEGLHQYYNGNIDEAVALWKVSSDARAANALGIVYLNDIGNRDAAIASFQADRTSGRGRLHLLLMRYQDEPDNRDQIQQELEDAVFDDTTVFTQNHSDIDAE